MYLQAFTLIQYFASIDLLSNNEVYDYMVIERIWRFFSLGMALVFDFVYVSGIASFFTIVSKSKNFVQGGK